MAHLVEFWARGYRSLADVHMTDLGTCNVLYGSNGSGKSNILSGMESLFETVARLGSRDHVVVDRPSVDDLFAGSTSRTLLLGGVLVRDEQQPALRLEVTMKWTGGKTQGKATLSSEITPRFSGPQTSAQDQDVANQIAHWVERPIFSLIGADRIPREEPLQRGTVTEHLMHGRLKNALFAAHSSPDPIVRDRFKRLQMLLAAPPLSRLPFSPVLDPTSQKVDIRENLPGQPPRDVPLDLVGLGVAQVYFTLAKALLPGASMVALEEPEAHLHGPTTGVTLRTLLRQLVDDGILSQLFIATHSNLFDLDPTGYWDVRLEDGKTVVRRAPLSELDARHLYEPGPAMQVLRDMLAYKPDSEVVFRRADGTQVTAKEMLEALQSDTPDAIDFLKDVHAAAVRAVRLGAR